MVQTVILFALIGIMFSFVIAEWHCGADNIDFTKFISENSLKECSANQRAEVNNACKRHDNCYTQAKPANGGSEKARNHCDRVLCQDLRDIGSKSWLSNTDCLFALEAHCDISFAFGWIAQIDWPKEAQKIPNFFENVGENVGNEFGKAGKSVQSAWDKTLDWLQDL